MRFAWEHLRLRKIPDFDAEFYGSMYPDLKIFKSRRALLNHYIRHGKKEGRFASLADARAHLEARHGAMPSDFDVEVYRQLNPDLQQRFSEAFQFELHFLEFGRFEDRPYRSVSPRDAWHSLLNVYDFNLLNESWLPKEGVDRSEAISLMESEGVTRLAPLARAWIFDPMFYRAFYEMEGEDTALYAEWLNVGFASGRAPNEEQAIRGLLGGKPYPECFDWQRYCRLFEIANGTGVRGKIAALEDFFEGSLDQAARSCVLGAGAGRLFEAVGDRHLIRGQHAAATTAYNLAIEGGAPSARLYLRQGDALKGMGNSLGAIVSYRQAVELPDGSIWALIHAANLMLAEKMFHNAMKLVETHSARFRHHELFDGFVDEILERLFRAVSDAMMRLISDEADNSIIDDFANNKLDGMIAFLRKLKIGQPLQLPATTPRRIIILACLDLAQCTFYRVEQKRILLEAQGYEVEIFDFNNPLRFISALPGARVALFYRVPCYPKIIEAILYARSLGIETFFDIDDLIFTRDFPDAFETYENQITRQDYFGLCYGVALYRHAIQLCNGAIVSTAPLAEAIAPFVSGGHERTYVVPNGLDNRSDRAARFAQNKATPGESISIFYGSGTKAHNSDFTDIVAPALLELFESHQNIRFVVVGHLGLDRRFDRYASRISRFPFVESIDTYWAILASCDINISVLRASAIADAKSEIKWLEAAMMSLPSIVSPTRTFKRSLIAGQTGLFARDVDDWRRQLRTLVEDLELRKRIGAAARAAALKGYGPAAITAKLETALFGNERTPTFVGDAQRRRILICNVFFAPQSFGGATRVVENNVDDLIERYGDEFEISILSTYAGLRSGALKVDVYRGRPVYRIGTPVEVNMNWRPFNDDMLPPFRRVLDVVQPDLIHFHCMQRLTASVVEEALRAGFPYLVTVHDAWWISDHQFLVDQNDRLAPIDDPFQVELPAGVKRTESLARVQRLKSLLNAAFATLTVSVSFARLYARAGAKNVRVCENGLGEMGPRLPKTTPNGKIVLGHIGGRSAHKGASLIEAVLKKHNYRNLELVMVDGTLEVGEHEIVLWGTTPVTLRAPTPIGRVNELYASIDVLLAPSIWPESYGLVVREALHYRTWVVVSNRGALPQDVIEGENGFVVEPTPSDSLAAVLKQIDDDVVRFKMPVPQRPLRLASAQAADLVDVYRKALTFTQDNDDSLFS
jgi:glycosyltransferase involved in cell wall biosynthesis